MGADREDLKLLELVCGDFKRTGFCFVGESLKGDILIAFNAGKALKEGQGTKQDSLFQRFRVLRLSDEDRSSSIQSIKRYYDQWSSRKDMINKRVDVRIQTIEDSEKKSVSKSEKKDIRKEEETKMIHEERGRLISKFEGQLDVHIYEKSSKSIIADVKCVEEMDMDYDWFKLSAKWFFQRQSLKNYEI